MKETMYFAMGLHARDQDTGILLKDVSFHELVMDCRQKYIADAKYILKSLEDKQWIQHNWIYIKNATKSGTAIQ